MGKNYKSCAFYNDVKKILNKKEKFSTVFPGVEFENPKISFSIDGASQQTYEKYRVGGHFERAFNNMSDLVNIKNDIAGIRTCVNTISGKVDKAITDSAKALPAWAVGIIGLLTAAVGWLLK